MSNVLTTAAVTDFVRSFVGALGDFLSEMAEVRWEMLLLGVAAFGVYLTLRARAYFNIVRAAYPAEPILFRRIWGAYFAAYGFNNVIPARGGDLVRLFLTKTSVPNSAYPAIASSFTVELIFDLVMGALILTFALSQGVLPRPPDFADLPALDLAILAANPDLVAFVVTALAMLGLVAVALLSARVQAFWARVRQGLTILRDRRRYLREVFLVQLGGWAFRFAAFWMLLEAFGVGGSVRNVLLVLGVNAVAALVPFTPGGAGIQQALLAAVFAGAATGATIAAYAVGAQVAVAAFSFTVGFAALVLVFGLRSFKDVIASARQARAEA